MITTNALAAFAQEVTRNRPTVVEPAQARPTGTTSARAPEPAQQRMLDVVPPAPAKPLPRGSLLDLRA